jgi:phosphatidylglycerol:prolipoprotein diacylglycerol transferase
VFPYIHIPTLFGIIQPFGILVACGVLLGTWMMRKYGERNGIDDDQIRHVGVRVLIGGLVGCHLFNVFFYEWDRLLGIGPYHGKGFDWLMLINPFDGISSWGGIVGGTIAFLWQARVFELDKLRWADALAWGAVGGWVPGRAACAVVHDHTAGPTDFWLGLKVPLDVAHDAPALVRRYAGQTIHDLGLYELAFLIPIFVIIVLLERLPNRKPGLLMGVLAVLYSVPRFFIDSLRFESTDPRYGGLTFAQWGCIAAFIFGLVLLVRPRGKAVAAPAPEAEPESAKKPAKKRKKR